jgi:hypothetical protein
MKTLKQLLQENIELVHYFREVDAAIDSVEEWLIQKRQSKAMNFYELQIIDELLGDLKK